MEGIHKDRHQPQRLHAMMGLELDNHPSMEDQTQQEERQGKQPVAPPSLVERSGGQDQRRQLQDRSRTKEGCGPAAQEPEQDEDVEQVVEPARQHRDPFAVIDRSER